jgi:hypothetical protein
MKYRFSGKKINRFVNYIWVENKKQKVGERRVTPGFLITSARLV